MSKHTSGPWRLSGVHRDLWFVVQTSTDINVAEVFNKANASLIAAAPELLKALEAAEAEIRRLHYLHCPEYEGKVGEPDLRIADEARAAIDKARR